SNLGTPIEGEGARVLGAPFFFFFLWWCGGCARGAGGGGSRGGGAPRAREAACARAVNQRARAAEDDNADTPPDAADVVVPADRAVDREPTWPRCAHRNRDRRARHWELEPALPAEEAVSP